MTAASDVPVPPPRRRSKPLLRGLAVVVLALVVAIATHPWWLAPLLAGQLRASSGRDVRFASVRIGLTPTLAPKVSLYGVRIANAP